MVFYLIIVLNLNVPTLLSLVGGPLSGNGCGVVHRITYNICYFLLLY
jgi:hypothetical protein